MGYTVVTKNNEYLARNREELDNVIKHIKTPWIAWSNSHNEKDIVGTPGWYIIEEWGNHYLIDPIGEKRHVSWGSYIEAIEYSSWREYDLVIENMILRGEISVLEERLNTKPDIAIVGNFLIIKQNNKKVKVWLPRNKVNKIKKVLGC